jgi:integrase
MPVTVIRLTRTRNAAGDLVVRLGAGLLDEYLEFLAGRCRPNTVLAVAYDLKVFFTAVGKPPRRVRPVDVLAFMTAQRTGGQGRLQVAGAGAGGVSARTLRRRLSSVSGLYGFLLARGDVTANPVPRGLPTRRERQRPGQGVPLVRVPRTLPQILSPAEVDALTAALRTHRDRAMVAAMVLGGLRRCEVLGLRLGDLRFGDRRLVFSNLNNYGYPGVALDVGVPVTPVGLAQRRTRPRPGSRSRSARTVPPAPCCGSWVLPTTRQPRASRSAHSGCRSSRPISLCRCTSATPRRPAPGRYRFSLSTRYGRVPAVPDRR